MTKTLDVFLENTLVGHLIQDQNGRMLFTYHENWLANTNAIPLSCSLPLQPEPFNQKACRGFFAGILPEETNRKIIARILGVSAQNDYAMLEQIGGECAGAVTFLPTGAKLPERNDAYQTLDETALKNILEKLPKQPLLAGEPGIRLTLAGAQDKFAVHVDEHGKMSLPLNGAPSTHILKPAIARFPNLVSNEALCLALAKAIDIPTVTAKIGFAGEIEYILVKRYDRITQKNNPYPLRLHQEDFCQALGIPSTQKYQSEGGPNLKNCFTLLRDASTFPAIDIKNLLNLVIFNLIIGNHDAHGKNFSLLFDTTNHQLITKLAPAYDILSTVYYPELTQKMAMKIGKEYKSSRLTLHHIEKFALETGLEVPAVRNQFTTIAEKVKEKLPSIASSYPKASSLTTLIDKRATRIEQLVKTK